MRGGGAQAIVRAAGLASAAVTTPLLARHLGAGRYGDYIVALTVAWVVATIADMGLPLVASRDLPRLATAERPDWLAAFWSLRLWSAAIVTVVAVTVVAGMTLDVGRQAAITVGLLAVPVSLLGAAVSSLFLAQLNPWPATWSELVGRAAWVVGLIVAVSMDSGVVAILAVLVATKALGVAAMVVAARRSGLLPRPSRGGRAVSLAWAAAPLGVLPLLGMVYARADTLVMAAMVSGTETGIYGAMWVLVEGLVGLATIGASLLLPLLSSGGDPDVWRRRYLRATRLLMMVLLPIATAVALLATPVLTLLGGPGFFVEVGAGWGTVSPSVTLAVMMGGLALMGIGIVHGAVMVATDRQSALIRQSVMVVVCNLSLAWLLIPRLSFLGAAIAVVATELVSITHSTWVVRGAIGQFSMRDVLAWPIAIAASLAAALALTGGLPVLARLAVGVAVAGAVAWRSPLRSELGRILGAKAAA